MIDRKRLQQLAALPCGSGAGLETCHHRRCILLPVRTGWQVTQCSLVVVAPGEVESSATHSRGRIPSNSGGLMAEGDNILANNPIAVRQINRKIEND